MSVGALQQFCVEHPGEPEISGLQRGARDLLKRVEARYIFADVGIFHHWTEFPYEPTIKSLSLVGATHYFRVAGRPPPEPAP